MKKVLIVDDETIIRVALRSMFAWEKCNFEIVEDFMSPRQALAYLDKNIVDLVVTDMKMPDMNGLEFLKKVKEMEYPPVALVLSGYNEFELVREAFKLGAYDYILKADLQEDMLFSYLKNLNEKIIWPSRETEKVKLTKIEDNKPKYGKYAVVLFEIADFQGQVKRVGKKWKDELELPFLELARQIPRFSAKAVIEPVFPSRYVMYYKVTDEKHYKSHVSSIARQLQSVWKDYMNIDVSAAISEYREAAFLEEGLDDAVRLMKIAILSGSTAFCTFWEKKDELIRLEQEADRYEGLVTAIYSADQISFEEEKKSFFQYIIKEEYKEAIEECLALIALIALKFKEYNDDFIFVFPEEINYYEKLQRLPGKRELEMWMNNYFRWILDYCSNKHDSRQADLILRAKRFIADNYMTPELTLGSVSDYVGLNEKYFSTRFTKETGSTFSNYLIDVRMQKAKELLHTTNLKMYEISERLGYNNAEHFNRLFKRQFGISPRDYKKSL